MPHPWTLLKVTFSVPPFSMLSHLLPFAIVIVSALLGFVLSYREPKKDEVQAD